MRYCTKEEWREIPGYPGNEASTYGNLRTYWYKVRNSTGYGTHRELRDMPRPIPMSFKADGYLHVNIYCEPENRRHTRNVQTLIARTFIPIPEDHRHVEYTVDHIIPGNKGKCDNSVWNLQWLSRADNIRKAYAEGMCDDRIKRQCRPVMIQDMWTGDWTYYDSIKDAAWDLRINQSTLSHALSDGRYRTGHYIVEYATGEDKLLYGSDYYEDGEYY